MLRCGLATRGAVVQKHAASVAELNLCPLQIRRSASVWQHKGNSGRATTRIKKMPSRLELAERETMKEIRELKAKLATGEKTKEAKETHEVMGELDEDTLDVIYSAINAPDPATPEELRIEAKRRRMILEGRKGDVSKLDSPQGKVTHRLATLLERVVQIQAHAEPEDMVTQGSEKAPQVKAYDRVSFFGVPKKVAGVEEATKEGKGPIETAVTEGKGQSPTSMPASTSTLSGKSIAAEDRPQGFREEVLSKLQSVAKMLSSRKSRDGDGEEKASNLPLGIATQQEWEALAASFAQADDMAGVIKVLEVVEESGHGSLSVKVMNAAMEVYALQGQVERCQALAVWMTENQLKLDDHTHHCLVKSFLRAGRIASAMDLISQLEDIQPVSLLTYTMTLNRLLHKQENNPALQSRIWSLFNRMRLVAHPIPDAPCYAIMMRACAIGIPQVKDSLWSPAQQHAKSTSSHKKKTHDPPDTERALDLFREMTSRYNIRPNVDVYSALIECCVGRGDMYEKAWQLFRNMVEMDRHRMSSEGEELPSMAPNRRIFNLLLTGCRKNGDLLRARWILAEMLRSASMRWKQLIQMEQRGEKVDEWKLQDVELRRPDEKTMSEMFLAYAKVPLSAKLAMKVAKGESIGPRQGMTAVEQSQEQLSQVEEAEDIDEDTMTYRLPSTRKAVLREATSLMERIKVDHKQKGGLLSSVRPGVMLINSYLRVVAVHSDSKLLVERLRMAAFGAGTDTKSLFDIFGIQPDGSTYMTLLQSLGERGRGSDAMKFAWEVWEKWIEVGGAGHLFKMSHEKAKKSGLSAGQISTTWAAMIHILAKDNNLSQAMKLLRKFADIYPPLTPSDAALVNQHARASSSTPSSLLSPIRGKDIARLEASLPRMPALAFDHLKVLHMRLVETETHAQDIAYIKWLVLSYHPREEIPEVFRKISTGKSQVRRLLSERNARADHQSRSGDFLSTT